MKKLLLLILGINFTSCVTTKVKFRNQKCAMSIETSTWTNDVKLTLPAGCL